MSGPGPRPELRWLPTGRLVTDPAYQRRIDSRRGRRLIERITADFSWSCFGAILAAPAGEEGWTIIDGQHRVEAARRRKLDEVPAVVVAAADAAAQARLFVAANRDRVNLNPMALHHAGLAAGDESAALLDRVCRAARVIIPRYPIPATSIKPRTTLAVGACAACLDKYGPTRLRAALELIADAYEEQPGALRAAVVKAVCQVLADGASPEEVGAALRLGDAEQLRGDAARVAAGGGVRAHAAIADVIRTRVDHAVPSPAPAPVPAPAPAPERRDVLADVDVLEASAKFDRPKKRRCQICGEFFQARYVAEVDCPRHNKPEATASR